MILLNRPETYHVLPNLSVVVNKMILKDVIWFSQRKFENTVLRVHRVNVPESRLLDKLVIHGFYLKQILSVKIIHVILDSST